MPLKNISAPQSSETQKVQIEIDSNTLDYSLTCINAYVEDIYVVFREIVHSFETGEISGVFSLENVESGQPATKEEFAQVIAEVKQKVDESLYEPDWSGGFSLGRPDDFSN
jgi:hypothetical protein